LWLWEPNLTKWRAFTVQLPTKLYVTFGFAGDSMTVAILEAALRNCKLESAQLRCIRGVVPRDELEAVLVVSGG
jgi:hypothetical protein